MKYYECDNCHVKQRGDSPPVELRGIAVTAGDILLPEPLMTKHFCSNNCFWDWVLGQVRFVKRVGNREVEE